MLTILQPVLSLLPVTFSERTTRRSSCSTLMSPAPTPSRSSGEFWLTTSVKQPALTPQ